MRILVTGGTGFVGRSLVRRLLEAGAQITLLTRLSKPNLEPRAKTIVLGSETWSQEAIGEAIKICSPEAIVHLAGCINAESFEALYEANVFLGERLMAAAQDEAPWARILIVGSAAEYGPPAGPDGLSSEDDAARPHSAYGIAKLAQTFHALARAGAGQPIVVARLFNPVGPGMPKGLAFSDFAAQLATGVGTLRTGDLNTERDFMDVNEAARILVELLSNAAAVGKIVNVCSGVAQSTRLCLERLIASCARPIEIVRDPALSRPSGVQRIMGSTRRLEKLGIQAASPDLNKALNALMRQAMNFPID